MRTSHCLISLPFSRLKHLSVIIEFKAFLISWGLIIPGLNIFGLFVKSTTVDSIPIFELPPFIIILILFLKSSNTSDALTGLKFEDRFALGIARGKLINLKIVLTTLCFGNLIATVFNLAVANESIKECLFFFNMNVIGPGQNFL